MNIKITSILVLASLFLIYCTTTKIDSQVMAPNFDQKVTNLFYVINLQDKMEKTVPTLVDKSKSIYTENGFPFNHEEYTFFSERGTFTLENMVISAKEKNFDFFLILLETDHDRETYFSGPTVGANGMFVGGSTSKTIKHGLEAYLYTVSDTTEIWRAKIEVTSGDYGNSTQTGNSLAKGVIERLLSDGLLPSGFTIPSEWDEY
ncbi:MAG: hypothetical protein ED557_02255 [Balneola sp.]|nr:MAG: hypothetical protein ED557_02255 [Balneola sp.]